MRYFKCIDCGHTWNIIFWVENEGAKLACPECKSLNVQPVEKFRVRSLNREEEQEGNIQDQILLSDQGSGLEQNSTPNKRSWMIRICPCIGNKVQHGKDDGFIKRFIKHAA